MEKEIPEEPFAITPNVLKRPSEVVIEVTARCNLSCAFCFNRSTFARAGRVVPDMPTKHIKEIINAVYNSGIDTVRFTGGEPLLRKDIFVLARHAKSLGMNVLLNSNGTLIDRNAASKIGIHVDNLLISLNSFSPESEIRLGGTAEYFRRRMDALRAVRKTGIDILRAGTIATPENIRHLDDFIAIVQDIGLDHWELYRTIPVSKKHVTASGKDLKVLVDRLTDINNTNRTNYVIANSIPFCFYDAAKTERVSLGAMSDDGHSRFVVDPRGFAKPSYQISENIGDPLDIMGCWNSGMMLKFRYLRFVPDSCRQCDYLWKCKGGSRFIARLVNGDYASPDPLMKKPEQEINTGQSQTGPCS